MSLTDFQRKVISLIPIGGITAEKLGGAVWPDWKVFYVQGGGADRRTARMSQQLGRMMAKEMLWAGVGESLTVWHVSSEGRQAMARAEIME